MSRTLGELIEQLQELAEEHGTDIEVRLAHQPRWAFEYSIGEVAAARERKGAPMVAYIAEDSQVGYLPHSAGVALGWSESRDDEDDDDEGEEVVR